MLHRSRIDRPLVPRDTDLICLTWDHHTLVEVLLSTLETHLRGLYSFYRRGVPYIDVRYVISSDYFAGGTHNVERLRKPATAILEYISIHVERGLGEREYDRDGESPLLRFLQKRLNPEFGTLKYLDDYDGELDADKAYEAFCIVVRLTAFFQCEAIVKVVLEAFLLTWGERISARITLEECEDWLAAAEELGCSGSVMLEIATKFDRPGFDRTHPDVTERRLVPGSAGSGVHWALQARCHDRSMCRARSSHHFERNLPVDLKPYFHHSRSVLAALPQEAMQRMMSTISREGTAIVPPRTHELGELLDPMSPTAVFEIKKLQTSHHDHAYPVDGRRVRDLYGDRAYQLVDENRRRYERRAREHLLISMRRIRADFGNYCAGSERSLGRAYSYGG